MRQRKKETTERNKMEIKKIRQYIEEEKVKGHNRKYMYMLTTQCHL